MRTKHAVLVFVLALAALVVFVLAVIGTAFGGIPSNASDGLTVQGPL